MISTIFLNKVQSNSDLKLFPVILVKTSQYWKFSWKSSYFRRGYSSSRSAWCWNSIVHFLLELFFLSNITLLSDSFVRLEVTYLARWIELDVSPSVLSLSRGTTPKKVARFSRKSPLISRPQLRSRRPFSVLFWLTSDSYDNDRTWPSNSRAWLFWLKKFRR